ncbi:autotransporter domain-containing protein [Microvirga sp. M2]|uniref:autotransporter domain-containing protein n=1 Tax=Microvirga sp. M2 TaxID=3073270 RepID=UPI0039C45DC4
MQADPWHVTTGTQTETGKDFSTTTNNARTVAVDQGATGVMYGGSITTTGNNAVGLYVEGTATMNGVAVVSQGSDTVGGTSSSAVFVKGGDATFNGGSILSNMLNAGAVIVKDGGRFTSSADISASRDGDYVISIESGGTLNLIGGRISNSAYFSSVVNVRGDGSSAIVSNAEIVGSLNADGIFLGYGSGIQGTVVNSSITTSGDYASGILAQDGSDLDLSGSTVSTTGEGSQSLWVQRASAGITSSTLSTSGDDALGLVVGEGSSVSLIDTGVTTEGQQAHGIGNTNSAVTMEGGSITTHGAGSYGAYAQTWADEYANPPPVLHASLLFDGTTITTNGDLSYGVAAFTGSEITLSGGTSVRTKGVNSFGAVAGPGGTLSIVDSTITAEKAAAIRVNEGGTVSMEGAVIRSGGPSISVNLRDVGSVTIDASERSSLTENNGRLLEVIRPAIASPATVNLVLGGGTAASGMIVDDNLAVPAGGTDVTLKTGARLTGGFQGVRNVLLDNGTWVIAGSTGFKSLMLGSGGGVIDTNGADATLSGTITGTGGLRKRGIGTLALTGNGGGYGGTLSISQGAILLTGSLGGKVDIMKDGSLLVGNGTVSGDLKADTKNNGTLVFNQTGDYDYTGDLDGSGALVKKGTGLLLLSGEYRYTGSTVVQGGSIQLASGLNPETDLVIDGGTFDLSGRSQTVAGLSGGAGRLNLGNGNLVVNQNGASTFGGSLTGNGTFTKSGDGRLNLTGTSTFSGSTLVNGGTLAVNGSLARSQVNVRSGGILGGNGTVGGIAAGSNGTVAPGNSIGALKVAGDVSFGAGSIYQVEVNAAGENDRIDAAGKANLTGGTVQVLAASGAYAPLTNYTILTAQGGVSGTFAGVTSNFAFLKPSLLYTADTIQLALSRNAVSFAEVAETRNQSAAAAGAEALGAGHMVYNALVQLDAANARSAFDALSGEVHASAATSAYGDAREIRNAVLGRLRQPAGSPATVAAAFAADLPGVAPLPTPVPVPTLDPRRFALWGTAFGSWGKLDGHGNAAGMDTATGGFAIGADATFDQAYRIGIAGGFTRTTFDIDGRLSSGSNESVFGALYGSGTWGGLNLRLGTSYAIHDIDTSRRVVFPGFSDNLSASYNGWTAQAFGELGYRFEAGIAILEPFVGASILRLHTDGFGETGGAAALTGFARGYDLGTTTVGLRAEARLGADVPLMVRGLVGWRHAYGDVEPVALLAFGNGTAAFAAAGVPVDRDALVAEAGLDWQATQDISLGVSYQGQIGERAQDHGLKGNFTWRF